MQKGKLTAQEDKIILYHIPWNAMSYTSLDRNLLMETEFIQIDTIVDSSIIKSINNRIDSLEINKEYQVSDIDIRLLCDIYHNNALIKTLKLDPYRRIQIEKTVYKQDKALILLLENCKKKIKH